MRLYELLEATVQEVAPEGWEGTVKAMKKHKDIDNPYALAWYMKNKGYKSHKKESLEEAREPRYYVQQDAVVHGGNRIQAAKIMHHARGPYYRSKEEAEAAAEKYRQTFKNDSFSVHPEDMTYVREEGVAEGAMKDLLWDDAEHMSLEQFLEKHAATPDSIEWMSEFWNNVNGVEESKKENDIEDQLAWDEKMARLKKLAGQGELKTVWDPVKRVYKNVPVSNPNKNE